MTQTEKDLLLQCLWKLDKTKEGSLKPHVKNLMWKINNEDY